MKQLAAWSLLLFFLFSCARLPVQSVALTDALQTEGERMHKMNVLFLNRIFDGKRQTIEKFIKEEYTPMVVAEFTKSVEERFPEMDYKKRFPDLFNLLSPRINKRRDSLITALELQKEKLVDKLNADYSVYNTAAIELKNLLASNAKVNQQREQIFNQIKTLSNNRLDFNSIDEALDRFIHTGGSVANNINLLNNLIHQTLTNK